MSWLRNWLRNWLGIAEAKAVESPYSDCFSLDFLFAETREILLRQWTRVEALDNKAGLLAGFDGVIIAAAVGILPAMLQSSPSPSWASWSLWIVMGLLTLGLLGVLVSFLIAAKGFRVQSYYEVFNPETAYETWIYWHERKTKMQLRANLADAYKKNEASINQKAAAIKVSLVFLLVGLILFCTSAIGYIAISVI